MSPALALSNLPGVTLVSSAYAIDEAERNLDAADTRARLYRLIQQIEIADVSGRGNHDQGLLESVSVVRRRPP